MPNLKLFVVNLMSKLRFYREHSQQCQQTAAPTKWHDLTYYNKKERVKSGVKDTLLTLKNR